MRKKLLLLAAFTLLGGIRLYAQSSPNTITGLKLWLDASDVNNGGAAPSNNAVISTWKDKSGNGNDATVYAGQSGGAYHTNQINGKSVVAFTRTSQTVGCVYNVAGVDIRATAMPAVTIFTVYRQGAQSGDQGLWGDDNGNWDRFYFTSWTSNGSANNGGASLGPTNPAATVTGAGIVGTTRLLTAVYNSNVANGSAIYFNGATVTTFTDQTDATAAQTTLRIGFDGDDNCYNGDIAEMIVYNRKLTDCEIMQVNRYLGAKYGITFSTAGITTTDPTTFYEGARATLTATPSGATGYQWLKNGVAISGATSSTYTAYTAGSYQVAVTNSCTDTSAATAITVNTMTPPGNALSLDGTNDYVDLGNPDSLAATNIKTMECWVKFNNLSTTTTSQEILSKSIVGQGLELLLYNNGLCFYVMGSSSAAFINYPTTNFVTGIWYHLAATWNGTNSSSIKLYVNGVSVGSVSGSTTNVVNPAGSTFRIGQWSDAGTTRYFNGSVDEVRLWNRERTQAELTSTMYAPLTLPQTGLLAYYKFDQGTAGASNSSSNYLYDYSGRGNLGTLNNFALTGSSSNWVESYSMVRPVIVAASSVHGNSFTANWTAPVTGTVTNYLLDVATDSLFTSKLTGYNAKNVGAVTSATITGLTLGQTYYYRVTPNKSSVANQAGPAAFSSIITNGPALAVNLIYFKADQYTHNINLNWSTASEQMSDYFGVEHSTDGINYTEIGRVKAVGNSVLNTTYAFTDVSPAQTTNFYRLKQVDVDGSFKYSQVVKAVSKEHDGVFRVYPSPANTFITLETSAEYLGTFAVLADIQGRELVQIPVNSGSQRIDIQQLPAGIYIIKLVDGKAIRIEKN
ncbi:LamG-like jellyroll fold domain-containing protein [Chitinophagaceae bacterium MMS25-I14]